MLCSAVSLQTIAQYVAKPWQKVYQNVFAIHLLKVANCLYESEKFAKNFEKKLKNFLNILKKF